jgi:hypothetical protein
LLTNFPPADYQDIAWKLADALRDAIDTDVSGAEEREVRRKADPAKDLVRQFLAKYRAAGSLDSEESYQQLNATIRELGAFYTSKGQRARLDLDTGRKLLDRLQAAEDALPPRKEPKKLLPF